MAIPVLRICDPIAKGNCHCFVPVRGLTFTQYKPDRMAFYLKNLAFSLRKATGTYDVKTSIYTCKSFPDWECLWSSKFTVPC